MAESKTNKTKKFKSDFKFPAEVLKPVGDFLQKELDKLTFKKTQIKTEDPFSNPDRVNDNASEDTDAYEQFGHVRSEALKSHIDERIVQIRKALTRVKIGKYGICSKCGRLIDTKRLMAFPETTLCIECQKKEAQKKEE